MPEYSYDLGGGYIEASNPEEAIEKIEAKVCTGDFIIHNIEEDP